MSEKRLIKLFVTAMLITTTTTNKAQQPTFSNVVSARIADKLKDTLILRPTQRDSIYNINMEIYTLKENVRQKSTAADRKLQTAIQRIENSRDSLYKPVLGEDKYILYKQKKRYLVNAN